MAPVAHDIVRACRSCGVLFILSKGTKNQLCCHEKCRNRARRRSHVGFDPPSMRATPLSVGAVLLREFLYAMMHPHAIGIQLWSEALECWFPQYGKRLCFDGSYSQAPFFRLGGIVVNNRFLAWEPPRVPVNGRYRVRWVLDGGGTLDPKDPLWIDIDFAQDMDGTASVQRIKRAYVERLRLPEPTQQQAQPALPAKRTGEGEESDG